MTDKELDEKSDDLMRLFFTFCSYEEIKKYINEEDSLTESGEYMLAVIRKWLRDNVMEVEQEGEKARLWTPWTK